MMTFILRFANYFTAPEGNTAEPSSTRPHCNFSLVLIPQIIEGAKFSTIATLGKQRPKQFIGLV